MGLDLLLAFLVLLPFTPWGRRMASGSGLMRSNPASTTPILFAPLREEAPAAHSHR
jgi:hypothetical protein